MQIRRQPDAATFRAWRAAVRDAVQETSSRPHDALPWILEVESASATYEAFADSAGFESLDTKLGAALCRVITGPLAGEITTLKETEIQNRRSLRGRQILFLIYRHYQQSQQHGALNNLEDLLAIRYNDNAADGLAVFLTAWDFILSGMEAANRPDDNTLHGLYLAQVRRCTALHHDLEIYHRLPDNHPDKSYMFLLQASRSLLQRQRQA